METPEEIQELKEEIRTKGVYIEELKSQWKETKEKDEKIYFGNQINAETGLLTAKENRLTALITSLQQGSATTSQGTLVERLESLQRDLDATRNQLKTTQSLIQDPRLSYFSKAMPKSKGSHSTASRQIKNTYGQICLFCGSNEGVTLAHLVVGNADVDYSAFGRPTYREDLDVKSARNFIPLCGTLGMEGSCHNEFDQHLITVVHNPFGEAGNQYKLQCLRCDFAKYDELNQKIIVLKEPYPYRRLLAWRNRKCLIEHGHLCDNEIIDIVQAGDLSEIANSVNNDDPDNDDAESDSANGDYVDGVLVKSTR